MKRNFIITILTLTFFSLDEMTDYKNQIKREFKNQDETYYWAEYPRMTAYYIINDNETIIYTA